MAAPAAPTIPGFSPEQNASLQEWVMGIINDRMQLAGTVVSFVNDLDVKQKEVIAALTIEADRVDKQVIAVNQYLADMTILKDAIEKTHTTVSEITAGTASFADSTRAEFEATSLANKEAHEKVDTWVRQDRADFRGDRKEEPGIARGDPGLV